jgi:hypothetical protein
VIGAAHREALDEGRFVGAGLRRHQRALQARRGPLQGERHGQSAVHQPQLAAERELAGELEGVEASRVDLPGGRQDAERDRQVEPTPWAGRPARG